MAIVTVTRLHLASIWSFPAFFYWALVSSQQARRSPGFITGWLSTDSEWSFWTSTVWESTDSMRGYRNSGVHLKAMPKLLHWCDEASFAHWEQEEGRAPTQDVAYDRLAREGKLSKVNAPSARQKAGERAGRAKAGRLQVLSPSTSFP